MISTRERLELEYLRWIYRHLSSITDRQIDTLRAGWQSLGGEVPDGYGKPVTSDSTDK